MSNLIDLFHSQPGILQEIERQLLAGGMNALLPGSGMAYNALRAGNKLTGNSLTNWLNGLGGSNSNPTQQFDPNVGGSPPVGPGTFAGDPTDPNNPGAYSSPFGPDSSTSRAAWDRASGASPGVRPNVGGNTMGNYASINYWANNMPGSAFNRFTVGRAYSPTANVAGSSDYVPFSKLISHGGIDGGTSAFEQYVLSRTQL